MHLLFLDESGKLDQGGLFALGGVAVRDRDCPALRDLWQATLRDHGWPLEREASGTASERARSRPRHPASGELEGVGLKRFPEAAERARTRERLF